MKKPSRLFILLLAIVLLIGASSYLTSCKKDETSADQVAYDAADGLQGARLYDHVINYQREAGKTVDAAIIAKPDFFRCKSCHGWDLLGQKGVLINKPGSATYPVVAAGNLYTYAKAHSIREVFDAVKHAGGRHFTSPVVINDAMPNYGEFLTDAQIWNLTKFLKETAHNVSDFYDMTTTGNYPTGTRVFSNIGKGGNAANGQVVYDAKCKSCHGADGTTINVYCKNPRLVIGVMLREDPHEIQHKSIWGMPNDIDHFEGGCPTAAAMPIINITDQDIRDMMAMGQNTTKFPAKK